MIFFNLIKYMNDGFKEMWCIVITWIAVDKRIYSPKILYSLLLYFFFLILFFFKKQPYKK